MNEEMFFEDFDDQEKDIKTFMKDEQIISQKRTNLPKSTSSAIFPPTQTTPVILSDSGKNENNHSSDDNSLNEFFDAPSKITTKKEKTKKASLLPSPQKLPELLEDVKNSELHDIDIIVTRVLASSFPSMTALKEYYVSILNSYAVTLRKTPITASYIHQIATFFVNFANRVSPTALENFKKTLGNHQELLSLISAIESTPIFDE